MRPRFLMMALVALVFQGTLAQYSKKYPLNIPAYNSKIEKQTNNCQLLYKDFNYFQRTCAPSLNALPTTSPSTR